VRPPESRTKAMNAPKSQIVVVDPAVKKPELECFNLWNAYSPMPMTYHLPVIAGLNSLKEVKPESVAGILIFGSGSSVNDELEWQMQLESWLRPYIDNDTPMFGFCYGHQMLAKMFGNKCRFAKPDKSKHLGFRKVRVKECVLWPEMEGELCVSHCEVIENVPASFEILAESQDVPFDGIRHKTKPIFGLQPHPEVTSAFVHNENIRSQLTVNSFDFGHFLVKSFLKFVVQTAKQA
jgi:GMP synthase-like glutamine amidotransferase